ncbi:MAG: DNA primase [Candidatus Magasanikbacteria bacterium]|nr:DNA primase [Candidatus Magasanikbacteria bacterium]
MSDTQRIKDRIDVVDLVGEYVQLKPAGTRHKGCCPFHNEKTPSFMVSKERQSWHCFGCNKGGDIFSFIQDVEGMEFVEALKFLAQKAGIQLETNVSEVKQHQKNRLRDIMQDAGYFYHNFLMQMEASQDARAYLTGRGVKEETMIGWQIGFVPEQWELLTKYLLKKGHSIDDLILTGLTIKKDGASRGRGFYDRFRGRIMFPIHDLHGNIVGFTGRLLEEKEGAGGKYVNTPQMPLYDKSRVIFGLHKAKKAIREAGVAVVVEGQMDVIASHQAGITHVVASSGTALTEVHIGVLKRYSNVIAMAFDADEAGMKAMERGIDLSVEAGLQVKIISIPEGAGKDPDDCIKKDPQMWRQAIADALPVMDWQIIRAFKGKDITNPTDKNAIANNLCQKIASMPSPIERDHWLEVVARKLQVRADVLREQLKQVKPQNSQHMQQEAPQVEEEVAPQSALDPFISSLIEELIMIVLKTGFFPALLLPELIHHHPLYEFIKNRYTQASTAPAETFLSEMLLSEYADQVQVYQLKGDTLFTEHSEQQLQAVALTLVRRLQDHVNKEKRTVLQAQIALAEQQGNTDLLRQLLEEFQTLTR